MSGLHDSISIKQVAPFLRAPSTARKFPDSCVVLLEDMKGDCFRDTQGNPILLMLGMIHGEAREIQQQVLYAVQRAQQYVRYEATSDSSEKESATLPRLTCVIEMRPREKDAPCTFRFPDRAYRSMFPVLQASTVPGRLVIMGAAFAYFSSRMLRPFLSQSTLDSIVLLRRTRDVMNHLPAEAVLSDWGGANEFDLDKYVEWRAREEGFDAADICPRGQGRAYGECLNGSSPHPHVKGVVVTAKGCMDGSMLGEAPRHHGRVSKRGSGMGFFSTTRWKEKLLILHSTGLVYFDSLDIAEANNAACFINICENCSVEERATQDISGPEYQFALITPAREYLFGVSDRKSAEAWVCGLRSLIVEWEEQVQK